MIAPVRIPIIKRCSGYFLRWYYNGWHYWQFYPGTLNYKTEGEQYRTYGTRSVTMSSGPLTEAQSEAVRTILNTREVYLFTDNGWSAVRIETGQAEIRNNLTTGCEVNFKAIIGSRMLSVTGFSPVVDVPISLPDDLCEVVAGTQIWMCKNWDANYPASKVYSDIEANRVVYGGLYTYDQIMAAGFIPDGWHIPTLAEWNVLLDWLGGFATAGGDLKTIGTDYWDAPNTGADNSSRLSFKGSGFFLASLGFAGLKTVANVWTASSVSATHAYAIQLESDDADATANALSKLTYCAVRLVKDEVNIYEPEAAALFARMDVQPSTALKNLINKTIRDYKACGYWDKCDVIVKYNVFNAQAGLLNWKGDFYNPTAVNSPVFTIYKGYEGDGISKYINTNYYVNGAGNKYLLNDAHLYIDSYVLCDQASLRFNGGGDGIQGVIINANSGTTLNRLNSQSGVVGPIMEVGSNFQSRITSIAIEAWRNGVKTHLSNPSTILVAQSMLDFAANWPGASYFNNGKHYGYSYGAYCDDTMKAAVKTINDHFNDNVGSTV